MVKATTAVTFFVFSLVLMPLATSSGESINFQYPSSVNFSQKFSVTVNIMNFSSGIYDVKIDIFNSTSGRIARIFDGSVWTSTIQYVNGAIDTSTSMTNSSALELNITQKYAGVAKINVTIKKGSITYKFGQYNLEVLPLIINDDSGNQNQSVPQEPTQNQTNQTNNPGNETAPLQNQTQIDYCVGVQVANISWHPSELVFGESSKLIVSFNASCYNHNYIKMLVYGSSSRIISYENGTKITSYASCQQGVEFDNLTSKDYSFNLPFYVYPNCDSKYDVGNYSVSLRICEINGANYYEEEFSTEISGADASICLNQTADIISEDPLDGEITDTTNVSNKINSLPPSKNIKLSGKTELLGGQTGEVVYQSTEIKSVTIAAYLMGILFLLLCAYLISNKGKI